MANDLQKRDRRRAGGSGMEGRVANEVMCRRGANFGGCETTASERDLSPRTEDDVGCHHKMCASTAPLSWVCGLCNSCIFRRAFGVTCVARTRHFRGSSLIED